MLFRSPELTTFLRNYFFTDAQLSDLMIAMRENEDLEAAARTWMNENPQVVESWLP